MSFSSSPSSPSPLPLLLPLYPSPSLPPPPFFRNISPFKIEQERRSKNLYLFESDDCFFSFLFPPLLPFSPSLLLPLAPLAPSFLFLLSFFTSLLGRRETRRDEEEEKEGLTLKTIDSLLEASLMQAPNDAKYKDILKINLQLCSSRNLLWTRGNALILSCFSRGAKEGRERGT